MMRCALDLVFKRHGGMVFLKHNSDVIVLTNVCARNSRIVDSFRLASFFSSD